MGTPKKKRSPGKWRIGQRITKANAVKSLPMGFTENSFVILRETPRGIASMAVVDESGIIRSWIVRHQPIKEANDWFKHLKSKQHPLAAEYHRTGSVPVGYGHLLPR